MEASGGTTTRVAYIAMGANLGNRSATLLRAVKMIDLIPGVSVKRVSHFIETRPVGGPPEQPNYLNAAVAAETILLPHELLSALNQIERALGRDRAKEERFGPRTCDLDILMIDDLVLDTTQLTIPHPRMHQRAFVLQPLNEIAPHAVHPILRKTVAELLTAVVGPEKNI